MFSPLTGDDIDLGLPSDDVEALLELGGMMATGRPSLIVHRETLARLQKWEADQ
jgi:hypothetical protein